MPAMPDAGGYVDAEAFKRIVGRVAPIAGTDDTLPVLTCVSVACDRGELEMVATDRYRLAVDRVHWTGPDGPVARIPATVLARFARAADRAGKVQLAIGDGLAGLSDGVRTMTVRTNCGEFPRHKSLMRADTDHAVIVHADAAALCTAADRAAKLAGRNDPRMGFDVGARSVTVTAVRDGQPAGTQAVAADVDGDAAEYGFNAGYLASVLAGFTGPVRIGLQRKTTVNSRGETVTTDRPAQLSADGDTFRALVMPVRRADS